MSHTRSQDRERNLAAYYIGTGFNNIPIDEVLLFNQRQRDDIARYMQELKNDERLLTELRGRPWAKGTREALIGKNVGADYREELSKFLETNDDLLKREAESGGRKSKKRKSKKRKGKRTKRRCKN